MRPALWESCRAGLTAGFTLAALAVLPPGPAHADAEQSREFYEDAIHRIDAGNPSGAIIQLRNALQQDPDNLDARLLLGRLYLQAGDGLSAEKELRRVHDARPNDDTEIMLGRALLMADRPDEALEIVGTDATTPEAQLTKLILRGNAHLALAEVGSARSRFDEVLAASPENADALYARARIDVTLGNHADAERRLLQLKEVASEDPRTWFLEADLSARQGRHTEAMRALDQIEERLGGHPQLDIARAQLFLQIGQIAAAEEHVKRVLEVMPQSTVALYLQAATQAARENFREANRILIGIQGQLFDFVPAELLNGLIKFNLEQYAQAERSLRHYLAVMPDNAAARRLLAATLLRAGNATAAIEVLAPLTRGDPTDAQALQQLASAQMRLGDYAAAMDTFQRLAASDDAAASELARTSLSLLSGGAAAIDAELAGTDPLAEGILLALDLLRQGDHAAALDELSVLRSQHPDNLVLLNLEGLARSARQDVGEARRLWEQALSADPDFAPALDNLNRLDMQIGDFEAVERRLRRRLEDRPGDEAIVARLANALLANGRRADAERLLLQHREEYPSSVGVARSLLSTYLANGETEKAIDAATDILRDGDDQPALLLIAGNSLMAAGRPEKAAEAFRRLVRSTPDSPEARLALARALVAAGERAAARQALQEARSLEGGESLATVALIDLALAENDYQDASDLVASLETIDATLAARHRARLLLRRGKTEQSIALLEQAMDEAPGTEVVLALHAARQANGQPEEAIAALRDWLERRPGDIQARLALASALLGSGDLSAAVVEYERLLPRAPDHPLILNNLAWIKMEIGAPDALSFARRAYGLAPDSPDIADTLGWILVREGELDEGLSVLRQAAASAPENPNIQYHLAYALHLSGNPDGALEILEAILTETREPFLQREAAIDLQARLQTN